MAPSYPLTKKKKKNRVVKIHNICDIMCMRCTRFIYLDIVLSNARINPTTQGNVKHCKSRSKFAVLARKKGTRNYKNDWKREKEIEKKAGPSKRNCWFRQYPPFSPNSQERFRCSRFTNRSTKSSDTTPQDLYTYISLFPRNLLFTNSMFEECRGVTSTYDFMNGVGRVSPERHSDFRSDIYIYI